MNFLTQQNQVLKFKEAVRQQKKEQQQETTTKTKKRPHKNQKSHF